MSLGRRSLLTSSVAGVGLTISGATPSLASASDQSRSDSGKGRPGHRPFPPLVDDPAGLLALPPGFHYEVVTYAGKTKLKDGQGTTPSNHDGTVVFDAGRGRLRLIQNHELGAGAALGVPHIAGTVYDPTALMAGGCTVIETDRHGKNYGEWGRHLRHAHQLRWRTHAMGHLAHLRGDRGEGRDRMDRQHAERHLLPRPRLRLRGLR